MTVLLIVHHSRRGADHLKLSAHFLNLLGLLLERCGQIVNLTFRRSNLCRLLFQQLVHRARRAASSTFAELAVSTYADRATANCVSRDAADKAGADEVRIADADRSAFTGGAGTGGCADVDVIAAVGEIA